MATMLCSALQRFEREAIMIGQLQTGYSELEYQLCMCAGMGGGDVEKAITELFSRRSETRRVRNAEGLGGAAYAAAGLGQEFDSAIEDILLCVSIRNQYAHCIWHDDRTGRLAFAHMEEIAAPNGPGADPINLTFLYVDELLRKSISVVRLPYNYGCFREVAGSNMQISQDQKIRGGIGGRGYQLPCFGDRR